MRLRINIETGRQLGEHETPEGVGVLSPGDTFDAPSSWYRARAHWHFLEVAEMPPRPDLSLLRSALASNDHRKLGAALRVLALEVPRTKAARVEAARKRLGE